MIVSKGTVFPLLVVPKAEAVHRIQKEVASCQNGHRVPTLPSSRL